MPDRSRPPLLTLDIIDTKPNPRQPRFAKVIEPEERTGYSSPHTIHCGPEGIYVSALGASDGDGPGGVFVVDYESFEPLGRWEVERGPQYFAYDLVAPTARCSVDDLSVIMEI